MPAFEKRLLLLARICTFTDVLQLAARSMTTAATNRPSIYCI